MLAGDACGDDCGDACMLLAVSAIPVPGVLAPGEGRYAAADARLCRCIRVLVGAARAERGLPESRLPAAVHAWRMRGEARGERLRGDVWPGADSMPREEVLECGWADGMVVCLQGMIRGDVRVSWFIGPVNRGVAARPADPLKTSEPSCRVCVLLAGSWGMGGEVGRADWVA
jgi:hypothetical protein